MKAPDPTPALLPPARLDEIRAQINLSHPVNDTGPNADARDLMRHIDALRAPAPDDGGEALGHRLYSILYPHVERTSPEGWRAMMGDGRERYVEAATALDAHGYARGVTREHDAMNGALAAANERMGAAQETIRSLTAELAEARAAAATECLLCQAATDHVRDREKLITRLREQVAEQNATIASLTADRDAARSEAHASAGALLAPKIELATMGLRAELAEARAALSDAERLMGAAIDNGATDRARALTAEADLDAERSLTTELRAMEAEALASADRWRAASERHEQEAVDARAALDAAQREYIEATERADIAEATVGNLRAELAEARAALDARMGHLDAALATIGTASAAARLDGAQKERERMAPVHKALVELEHWAKRFETEPQGVGLDAVEKRLAQARREATRVNLAENERRARGEGRQG